MQITESLKEALLKAAEEEVIRLQQQLIIATENLKAIKSISPQTSLDTITYSLKESPQHIKYRYFVPSRSGKTKGHYVRLLTDNSFDCTCPGFTNRQYCWAVTMLKNPVNHYNYVWTRSHTIFDSNRNDALLS